MSPVITLITWFLHFHSSAIINQTSGYNGLLHNCSCPHISGQKSNAEKQTTNNSITLRYFNYLADLSKHKQQLMLLLRELLSVGCIGSVLTVRCLNSVAKRTASTKPCNKLEPLQRSLPAITAIYIMCKLGLHHYECGRKCHLTFITPVKCRFILNTCSWVLPN